MNVGFISDALHTVESTIILENCKLFSIFVNGYKWSMRRFHTRHRMIFIENKYSIISHIQPEDCIITLQGHKVLNEFEPCHEIMRLLFELFFNLKVKAPSTRFLIFVWNSNFYPLLFILASSNSSGESAHLHRST